MFSGGLIGATVGGIVGMGAGYLCTAEEEEITSLDPSFQASSTGRTLPYEIEITLENLRELMNRETWPRFRRIRTQLARVNKVCDEVNNNAPSTPVFTKLVHESLDQLGKIRLEFDRVLRKSGETSPEVQARKTALDNEISSLYGVLNRYITNHLTDKLDSDSDSYASSDY